MSQEQPSRKRPVAVWLLDLVPQALGALLALPAVLVALMLSLEWMAGLGMYDPATGGDPAFHGLSPVVLPLQAFLCVQFVFAALTGKTLGEKVAGYDVGTKVRVTFLGVFLMGVAPYGVSGFHSPVLFFLATGLGLLLLVSAKLVEARSSQV